MNQCFETLVLQETDFNPKPNVSHQARNSLYIVDRFQRQDTKNTENLN